MTRKLLLSLLAAAAGALLAPAGAAAAPWTCEASVVRGTIGPAPAIEPVTANKDGAWCAGGHAAAAARYEARLGRERSLRLKLARRLRVTAIKQRGRSVAISGRISRPLGKPVQRVVVTRRVSCGRVEVVKRFKPKRNGRFRVALQGAKQRQVATFRFRTRVRYRVGNPRLFRTFTLPQYVDIG